MYVSEWGRLMIVLFIATTLVACSGSGGGSNNEPEPEPDIRASLPETAPAFTASPFEFPSGIGTDLRSFGTYSQGCDCESDHPGWDFMPQWSSYPDNQVPVQAVADGIITQIVLQATNTYNNQDHNTYTVWLGVAQEVDVLYTFEPFLTFDGTWAEQWLLVSEGDSVSVGDTIGYLPKVDGNMGENLIHIDFKVGIGSERNSYVCPTTYFSDVWRTANSTTMEEKILGSCTALCCADNQ